MVTLLCTPDGPTWPYSQCRKIRCKQTSQLSSKVPLETFPMFKSRLLHAMASLHYQEPPRDIFPERVSTSSSEASLTRHGTSVNHACPPSILSQLYSSGPCHTRYGIHVNHAYPPSIPSELHSSGPRLTRHGAYVNHACPPSLPFTLVVELGWETIFHGNFATLVLRTLVETSLVVRIFVVHQLPKPKGHKGKVRLHFNLPLFGD